MRVLVINRPSMEQCRWVHQNCTSYEAIIDHDDFSYGGTLAVYARKNYVKLHLPEEQAMYLLAWGDERCSYTFRDCEFEFNYRGQK